MPKIDVTCRQCGSIFAVYPAALRYAEKRGTKDMFCSRKCLGEARSAGIVAAKKRRGATITCAICGTQVHRVPGRLREGRVYLCSEACRLAAHEAKLIDKTGPRPWLLRGEEITCQICGKVVYRKKSMIERRIRMTCGSRKCISAYSRSLWGLEPLTPEQARLSKGTARRVTNFTAAQRVAWQADKCAWCGSTKNLCLDHIIPVAAGGTSKRSNAQTLCQPCNIWKGNHYDRPLALARKQSQSGG